MRLGRSLSALVLVVGIVVSFAMGYLLQQSSDREVRLEMDRRSSAANAAVSNETGRYVDSVRLAAAAMGSHKDLEQDEFNEITQSLDDANLRGATGVAFIVPSDDGPDLIGKTQSVWRAEGDPDLTLWPAPNVREHFFAVFNRSFDGTPQTPGIDVAQAAEPTAALNEARRSGEIAVSDTYFLLKDKALPEAQRQRSFALVAPVYAGGTTELRGWLLMAMRGQDFVGQTLSDVNRGSLNASLIASDGAGEQIQVASVGKAEKAQQRDSSVSVAQRRWTLHTTASPASLTDSIYVPKAAAAVGILLSFMLAGLVYLLATSRARAASRVEEATAELRIAEAEARRQAGLLSAIMNSVADGVGVVDENGEFLLHNPAAKRMLGVKDDNNDAEEWQEHYGLFLPDGVTPFPQDELPLIRALQGESTDGVDMIVRNAERPEGLTLSVSGRPLDGSAGQRGAVAVFHDVTSIRERETELAAFAGVVAHDLRSPLTSISGYMEMLDDDVRDLLPKDVAEVPIQNVDRVRAAARRMSHLIDDLLSYASARDIELQPRDVSLTDVAHDVVAARTGHLPEMPDVYVSDLPAVRADASMVRQLLDNLVGNALKYHIAGARPRVDVTGIDDGSGWVRVQVADRGIGIPAGQHTAVFTGFNRAHRAAEYPGTGLGLAICQRIIDRHGGTISAADNPGGGSLFTFTLPSASVSERFGRHADRDLGVDAESNGARSHN